MVYIDSVPGFMYNFYSAWFMLYCAHRAVSCCVAFGNFTAISLIEAAGVPNLLLNLLYLDPILVLFPLSFHLNS